MVQNMDEFLRRWGREGEKGGIKMG